MRRTRLAAVVGIEGKRPRPPRTVIVGGPVGMTIDIAASLLEMVEIGREIDNARKNGQGSKQ